MLRRTEENNKAPYIFSRVINWGDTDAAQIVFTGNFFSIAMEAIEGWFRAILDVDFYELNVHRNLGTPFVHVDMDIKARLTPENTLNIKVLIDRIGRSSIAFKLIGERDDGVVSFESKYICSVVEIPGYQSISIPDEFRTRINDYMHLCEQH